MQGKARLMSVRVKAVFTCDGVEILTPLAGGESVRAKCSAREERWVFLGMGAVSESDLPWGWTSGDVPTGVVYAKGTPGEFHATQWEHRCPDHPIKKS